MTKKVTAAIAIGLLCAAVVSPVAAQTPTRSAARPIDKGPFTAAANRAYQGGGVILQGAPGAPAPMPEATPPGQIPRNSVPLR